MTQFHVNGRFYDIEVSPDETLADVLRDKLGFRGVHVSCERGECGACTILMDGKPIPSCMVLALKAEGKEITTIEGLGSPGNLHPIQKAFLEEHAFQCGFCTPGIILSAKALIDRKEPLTALQVSHALDGHICRCGSYPQIVKAIMRAADSQKKELRHE